MNNSRTLTLVLVMVITLAFGTAMAETGDARITVGKFLVDISAAMNLECQNAEQAMTAIRAQGFDIPTVDLDAVLTEGDVVSIAGALGQQVTSSTPDAPFSEGDAGMFIGSLEQDLGDSAGDDGSEENTTKADKPKVDPRDKGNGLKKGLYKKSASEPI